MSVPFEKLSAGVHEGCSMGRYHGDLCPGPSISGSGLVRIENECPAKYWGQSYLNPGLPPEEFDADASEALTFGKAMHCLLLEGEQAFKRQFAIKPEGMSFSTKEGKAWREPVEARGLTILTYLAGVKLTGMLASARAHPQASRAFTDGRPEVTIVWQDKPTGVWLKIRPDWLPNTVHLAGNFKTARCAKPIVWRADAFRMGYHQSAALVIDGLKAVLGWDDAAHYWLVQEKDPPYIVQPITMNDDAIAWGRMLNRRAIDTFAGCVETGKWPGYSDKVVEVEMPKWTEQALQQRHSDGEFASFDEGAYA